MINIRTIWEDQKYVGDIIIKTRIDDISHLNCFIATNHITDQYLYIMSIDKTVEVPDLKNYKFKGVELFALELEHSIDLNIYLIDNHLKDIFSLFIQNVLEDISICITEKEALSTTLNVISKWKKLFDKINFQGLSVEQQKGLIGELLFMNYILDNHYPQSQLLDAWTGPDFEDKDFIFGLTGVEVKFTSSKLPKLHITSERQLDSQNLDKLYLVLYTSEKVKENGFTLNSLIAQTRLKLSQNTTQLNFFNERIMSLGYLDEDAEFYNEMYSLNTTYTLDITTGFPRITPNQVPFGIYNTSYSIELSATEKFIVVEDDLLIYI